MPRCTTTPPYRGTALRVKSWRARHSGGMHRPRGVLAPKILRARIAPIGIIPRHQAARTIPICRAPAASMSRRSRIPIAIALPVRRAHRVQAAAATIPLQDHPAAKDIGITVAPRRVHRRAHRRVYRAITTARLRVHLQAHLHVLV